MNNQVSSKGAMARQIIDRVLPVLLWAVLIFVFSANSHPYAALPREWYEPANPADPAVPNTAEKLGQFLHAGEYAVLGFLVSRALMMKSPHHPLLIASACAFSFLYALSDEFHQTFVPGRTFQTTDLILDLIGILLGVGLYLYLTRKIRT